MRCQTFAALALLGLAACAKPETPEQASTRMAGEAAAARTAIVAQNTYWSNHVAAGHADSVGTVYAANTHVMGMNEAIMDGREAVVGSFRGMMGMGTWHITLNTDSVWVNGPLILERGHWTAHFAKGPNSPMVMDTADAGSYMVRWVKEGDKYLIADDIYNSTKPMPMPMPAPGRNH